MSSAPTTCPECGSADIRFRKKRNDWFCDGCDYRWAGEPAENESKLPQEQLPKVFLSYGRGDDELFVERLHRALTSRGLDVWWDRVDMPSRRLTFHQEIRAAIAERERLLFVVGPHAVASEYVRQEWQFALEADKVVTPILRLDDYPLVPDELKLLHCEDFREDDRFEYHLENLARQLAAPPPPLGKLISVPSLPPHYLAREDRLLALREAVRSDLERPVVITGEAARIGIHGMGGIGKSVLVSALVHDRLVREAFPDGIVWVAVGSLPDTAELQRRVHRELGGDGGFESATEGRAKLKELLADKSVLLILDDVWRRSDADDFDCLGPRCRALLTTRDAGLLTSLGGTHHVVELLTDQEALQLLAMAVNLAVPCLPAEAAEIVQECGRLPLAVALCGGMLQAGTPWSDVLAALREHELEFLSDEHAAETRHGNMWRAVEVSVATLELDVRQRLAELSAFLTDGRIPESAVTTLWEHTGNLSQRQTRQLLVQLKQRSLVQINRGPDTPAEQLGNVSLHDLIHDFATRSAKRYYPDVPQLHTQVIEAYRARCPEGWHSGLDDGYYFQHLCDHFIAAENWTELETVLIDLPFLEAKVASGMAFELAGDFKKGTAALPDDRPKRQILPLLEQALRRDLHFLAERGGDYPHALFQCLWNSCWWYDSPEAEQHYDVPDADVPRSSPGCSAPGEIQLHLLLEAWRSAKHDTGTKWFFLRAIRPPSMPLNGALTAVLRGHDSGVTCLAYSRQGDRIASGAGGRAATHGEDHSIHVWDADKGDLRQVLRGHQQPVNCVAFRSRPGAPDQIVSGSADRSIRLWDTETGRETLRLDGHQDAVVSLACSSDGHWIASCGGPSDPNVIVWDAESGNPTLRIQEAGIINCLAFSEDGHRLAIGAEDGTVCVRDLDTQALCWSSKAVGEANATVSFNRLADGRLALASVGNNGSLQQWDAETGEVVSVIPLDLATSSAFAWSSNNGISARVVGGGEDGTLRVWDEAGNLLRSFHGPGDAITAVACTKDGTQVIGSGRRLREIYVWDATRGGPGRRLRGHNGWIRSLSYSRRRQYIATGSEDTTVRLWDLTTGIESQCLEGHDDQITALHCAAAGARLVSGSDDGTIRVWDIDTGTEKVRIHDPGGEVVRLAVSPCGSRIVSCSGDIHTVLRVWDTDRAEQLSTLSGHELLVTCISFAADGRHVISGSEDRSVRIWDAATAHQRHCLEGHTDVVLHAAFFPDGLRAVSTAADGTARIWDVEEGRELLCLRGHERPIRQAACSSDGTRIVTAADDRTMRVWDGTRGVCLEVIQGLADPAAVANPGFSRWLAITRGLETVIRDRESNKPVASFPSARVATQVAERIWLVHDVKQIQLYQLEG